MSLKSQFREIKWNLLEYRYLQESVRKFYIPVREPLILVSQIQRSGGTLLSQLFDGHPQLHAHPHELKIGFPDKADWPDLPTGESPKKLLKLLDEGNLKLFLKRGYMKDVKTRSEDDRQYFRALFLPTLLKKLFVEELKETPEATQRDILNAYFGAYFNAWVDNRNFHGEKKYISAFVPGLSANQDSVNRFFKDYEDGLMIFLIRDPASWYASARKYQPKKFGGEKGLKLWLQSTRLIRQYIETFGQKVMLLRFEDLVGSTEDVMRTLCDKTGLDFHPCLLQPTFNGMPILADTSFGERQQGLMKSTLDRSKNLSDEELQRVKTQCQPLYEEMMGLMTYKPRG